MNATTQRRKVAPQLPLTIDADTGKLLTPSQSKRGGKRIRLTSLDDVDRELQRLIRECRNGQLAADVGTKLTYMLRTLAELKMLRELKARLATLEQQVARGGPALPAPDADDLGDDE
jgi:hypothetical protein